MKRESVRRSLEQLLAQTGARSPQTSSALTLKPEFRKRKRMSRSNILRTS